MKKFIAFTLIISMFSLLYTLVAEKTNLLDLNEASLQTTIAFDGSANLALHWNKLPYPCFYKVDTYSKTTGLVDDEPEYHFITSQYTTSSTCIASSPGIPTFYRVTACGLLGCIGNPSEMIPNPIYENPIRPIPIYRYTEQNPASLMPFLVWHNVPNAVCYEVEILSGLPDKEGGTELSKNNHLFSTRKIFSNGWQADLKPYSNEKTIYWRARALGLHHEAIGEFSSSEPLFIDTDLPLPDKPLINNFDQLPNFEQPIYPVYTWIPLNGIQNYEVELLVHPPTEENSIHPSENGVWRKSVTASSCYDEYARPFAGEYYWRVRAIDANGNTIGKYSDTEKFVVSKQKNRVRVAALGDSITHGGGAVSYPPCSLEYSYTTYLDFPVLNLGRSGDTSSTTLKRFSQDVLPFQPRNLLILTGTNSLRDPSISANDVIFDINRLKELCEEYDIRPIFLTLMPINPQNIQYAFQTSTDFKWREKMNQINNYIRQLPFHIDIEPYFYDKTKTVMDYGFSIDGLHPDIQGKMIMGEVINKNISMFRD